MRKLIDSINYIFLLQLGGFLIIVYVIWARFIRKRAIGNISFELLDSKCYLYAFLSALFLVLLISATIFPFFLKFLLRDNPSEREGDTLNKKNSFFNFVFKIVKTPMGWVLQGLVLQDRMLNEFLMPILQPFTYKYRLRWEQFIHKLAHIYRTRELFNLLIFLPPLIISTTYMVEITFFQSFKYFPFTVFLMVFPLGVKFVFRCVIACLEAERESIYMLITETKAGETTDYKWHPDAPELLDVELLTGEALAKLAMTKRQYDYYLRIIYNYQTTLQLLPEKVVYQALLLSFWLVSFSSLFFITCCTF